MKKQKKLKKFNKTISKALGKVKALKRNVVAKAQSLGKAKAMGKAPKKALTKAPKQVAKSIAKVTKKPVKAPTKALSVKGSKPLLAKSIATKQAPVKASALKASAVATPAKAAKGKPQILAAVLGKAKAAEPVSKPVLKAKGKSFSEAQLERLCRENACENPSTTKGYCRLDYIKNWKKIKRKEMILKEGKLNQYIEELVGKYPDKYIDVIRQDLSSEVNFNKVIHDLELDESIDDLDYDGDSIDALIGGIKKEDTGFGGDEF